MKRSSLNTAILAALAGSTAAVAHTAWSQEALEEIVVTATRREQNLQDVPLAVVAYTGESLETQGISHMEDLNAVVPNVVIAGDNVGTDNASFVMRGIPNVGTYIDGIWQVSNSGLLLREFVELDRVEVLRGPQGTLYGRDSTGGAIRLYTKAPARDFGVIADFAIGNLDRRDVKLAVDMPFTEINRIVEAQFTGKTFPEDGSGAADVTVKRASVAASGDRLLISLLVSAREKASYFGFSGEANVHIWGRPALDEAQQTLRLTDVELAVESEAAFGLLGAAARAVMPQLQRALAERATIDLKPFASNAQKKIAAMIADFQKNENGVRVAAEISKLRLADIAFDSKALRVIAEAEGAINVHISSLPGL